MKRIDSEQFVVGAGLGFIAMLIGLFVAAAVGWVLNIVAIAHADLSGITGMLILRCIGVFIAPLGAILGYC